MTTPCTGGGKAYSPSYNMLSGSHVVDAVSTGSVKASTNMDHSEFYKSLMSRLQNLRGTFTGRTDDLSNIDQLTGSFASSHLENTANKGSAKLDEASPPLHNIQDELSSFLKKKTNQTVHAWPPFMDMDRSTKRRQIRQLMMASQPRPSLILEPVVSIQSIAVLVLESREVVTDAEQGW
jgi:hypothetical protein